MDTSEREHNLWASLVTTPESTNEAGKLTAGKFEDNHVIWRKVSTAYQHEAIAFNHVAFMAFELLPR